MGDRLIISDNREDPGNPLVLDGEAIDAAARDPLAIGKLMVDQVWAEGTDPTGGGLYYERNSNQHRRLQVFETGSEDFMTGGWVRVLARHNVAEDTIIIEVKDTGIGISPKDISKAMTPFGQVASTLSRKYEGTGLGLPISRQIVEHFGGRIVLRTDTAQGACFEFSLPWPVPLAVPQVCSA